MGMVKLKKDYLKKELPFFIFKKCWLAGGAVRCAVTGDKIIDYDIFGEDKESCDQFITDNLKNYKKTHDTAFVKSFRRGKRKVQVVYRHYPSIEATIQDFDFTCAMFGWDGQEVTTTPEAIADALNKRLIINTIKPNFALDTMRRTQKYIKRGFSICDGGIKSIIESIRKLTDEEVERQFEFYADGSMRISRFD